MRPLRDSDFDEEGKLRRMPKVLADGETMRFSMAMSMKDSAGRSRMTDAALHRPGFRTLANTAVTTDAARLLLDSRKEADEAYAERDAWLVNAWRDGNPPTYAAQPGDVCTVRNAEYPNDQGSPGHLKMVNGALVCTPDQPRSTSARPMQRNDAQDIGTLQATHDAIMREEYSRFDQALEWRHV